MALFARDVSYQNGRSFTLQFGSFRTAFVPPPCSPANFDYGHRFPTNEGAGWCCLLVEPGHRSPEFREGYLWYPTSSGRIWLRQYPPNNDQGMSSPLRQAVRGSRRNQDSMANKSDYVELGLACADVCRALERGMNGKKLEDLSQSVCEAINQLTAWVKHVAHGLGSSLKTFLTPELWRRSEGTSSNGGGGIDSFDFSTRRTTRRQLPLGS